MFLFVSETVDENGKPSIKTTFTSSDNIFGTLLGDVMDTGIKLTSNGEYCTIERNMPTLNANAIEQWTKYLNTGNTMDYTSLLNVVESEQYSKISTLGTDYQAQNVPNIIKGTMSWDEYVEGFKNIDTDTAVSLLQKYVDLANTAR